MADIREYYIVKARIAPGEEYSAPSRAGRTWLDHHAVSGAYGTVRIDYFTGDDVTPPSGGPQAFSSDFSNDFQ